MARAGIWRVATERIIAARDDLVRIALKKPFSDGTIAIDMDPLFP